MFDPETARLLRSAPELPGLNPNNIPQLLTGHFAQLVSMRLRGEIAENDHYGNNEWNLHRIADSYELITSIHSDPAVRRSSAFVAACAQQIIARRQEYLLPNFEAAPNINRDRVDPSIAAALLFLAAEQYADSNEAASSIKTTHEDQIYEATILSEHILNLARGELKLILDRGNRWRNNRIPYNKSNDLEILALSALLETLIAGIEMQAAQMLALPIPEHITGKFDTPRQAFSAVLSLSLNVSNTHSEELGGTFETSYAGPRHLASLLIAAINGINEAALINIPPPEGADSDFWQRWISFRANKFPYIWPNHREAIRQGFHKNGVSTVMVLPTGAGKTTVSSLKIANVLAQKKKVIFLAPTHALVEQLTNDLQEMFPQEILGAVVSNNFDLLFQVDAVLPEIEVMTPERCLAMLSFSTKSFGDIGLLVFDECHLLSPESGKIRRALDGMLCVLAFNKIAPSADILFLSAMIKNGEEFSGWIGNLTGRKCISIDLLWKPSRQARGVVIYEKSELDKIKDNASQIQSQINRKKGNVSKGLRKDAERELMAQPHAIWGLQHNWLNKKENKAVCTFTDISKSRVPLTGELKLNKIHLKPNVNTVAAEIAALSAYNNLKTIVFVNQKSHAISVAKTITKALNQKVIASDEEKERWHALEEEVGNLKHSLLDGPTCAVPHNASMLRLERDIAERMFRRRDGAKVIVATPTLAQGLNLPAQLAILAGDKRAGINESQRESLEAHEILNAAARAGRAGHLANGVVLLIPEPILMFPENRNLDKKVVQKLQSILPEDDRCVEITDPLAIILDKISAGDVLDRDVRYMINRMKALNDVEGDEDPAELFNLKRSFAAFKAIQHNNETEFYAKFVILKGIIMAESKNDTDNTLAILASQSGLPIEILSRLKEKVKQESGSLPVSVEGWVIWLLDWLKNDSNARDVLLYDVKESILAATGRKKNSEFDPRSLEELLPGVISWLVGMPLCDIEKSLRGNPNSSKVTEQVCPRAREMVSSIIPRGLSFIMGLVTRVVDEVNPYGAQKELSAKLIECLSPAVRLGFNTPEKLAFSIKNPNILCRVKAHKEFVIAGKSAD